MRNRILAVIAGAAALLLSSAVSGAATYKTPEGSMKVEFCTPDMFRVRRSRSNSFEADENWMVVKYKWGNVSVKESEADGK